MKKKEKISKAKSPDTAKKLKKVESRGKVSLEALRKTEELYTKLVDTIPDSIVRTDLEGKILFVNDYTLKMSGFSREEIEGQNILTFVSPEEHEYMIKNILLMIEHGLGPREYNLIMKDGNKIPFEIHADVLRNEDGTPFGLVSVCRDISERKRTEGILREKEERLHGIAQNMPGIIFQFFAKDSGEYGVNYFSEPLGEFSEVIENIDTANLDALFPSFLSRIHEEDRDRFLNSIKTSVETGISWNFEGRVATQSGKIIWVQGLSTPTRHENQLVFNGILLNITDRKKAEDDLRRSEESFRNYLELAPDGVYMCDLNGTFLYGNRKSEEIIGYKREDIIGKNFLELNLLTEKGLNTAVQWLQENMKGNPTGPEEIELINKERRIIPVEIHSSVVQRMGQEIVLAFVRDITERKQAEETLRDSEEKYRRITENMSDMVSDVDAQGFFKYISPSHQRILGYRSEYLLGTSAFDKLHPDDLNRVTSLYMEGVISKTDREAEYRCRHADGHYVWLRSSGHIILDAAGEYVGLIISSSDITERKQAEEALKKSELKYRNIFENAIEGIYQSTIEGRFITANAALARMAGYDSPEELIGSIKDIGTQLYVNSKDRKRFMEIMDSKGFVEGFEVEFYKKDRSTFWVVINARTVKDEQGKTLYLEGLIEDITIRKHTEKQLQQTLESLRKAIGTTIQVLVSAVESRDSYTAGHQSRSADLARTIAAEMGLPLDKIEGIRMAGIIHDIGKLSVPAEILSKPTNLTNIEFSLIKEHARCGYGMLKDVESPWPLAEIVYQHHERMNGTGYPRNLKGDEILVESQILAVADVVEAMASHRPYRAALGIEAALEEIEKNKGILYAVAAADACLKLFREKGYQLT
jgi:PAS domain S-box-containing protein